LKLSNNRYGGTWTCRFEKTWWLFYFFDTPTKFIKKSSFHGLVDGIWILMNGKKGENYYNITVFRNITSALSDMVKW